MSLKHCGQGFVVGVVAAGGLSFAINALSGVTTKKYTAAATRTNETTALMKSPTGNGVPLTLKPTPEKSGFPTTAAISGVSKSLVNAVTTDPNAAPITTPTARSTT